MTDIALDLYDDLEQIFRKALAGDKKAIAILKKITNGKAKYSDLGEYADEVSEAMNKAFQEELSSETLPDGKMYWNIAERTIEPLYQEAYALIAQAVADVQQNLNTEAGIGLKAQTVSYDTSVANTIMNEVCEADQYDDVSYRLYESAKMYARSVVDDSLKANIDFQSKSGRNPKVIRTAEPDCCAWCTNLEGEYEYPNVPEEVYKRHENCKCVIEYSPGSGGRAQNGWLKEWSSPEESAKIEERKNFTGLKITVDREALKTKNF